MSTDRIRELNDSFRKSFVGGRVYLTKGTSYLLNAGPVRRQFGMWLPPQMGGQSRKHFDQ